MISKELLSEVLGLEIIEKSIFEKDGYLNYYALCEKQEILAPREDSINIHELAHKCKKWAMKEYDLWCVSYVTKIGATCKTFNGLEENDQMFIENTEPEAIFKACQWILDNKNKR